MLIITAAIQKTHCSRFFQKLQNIYRIHHLKMALALAMLTEIQNLKVKTTLRSSSTTIFTMAVMQTVLTICTIYNMLSYTPFPK